MHGPDRRDYPNESWFARIVPERLAEGDHDIDCKIDGFGATGLKSEFVRKA